MGGLLHLQGRLSISQLENVRCPEDADAAKLNGKKNIEELVFSWDSGGCDLQTQTAVLEGLCPHKNIKKLTIEKYSGTKFPNCMGDPLFANLIFLCLSGCKNCSSLPPLGQLPSLKELIIEKMDDLESISAEFYGDGSSSSNSFNALQDLVFDDLPNWRNWFDWNGKAFHSLHKLSIKKCPKLTEIPRAIPSLQELTIDDCSELGRIFVEGTVYTELQSLHIGGCKYLIYMEVSGDIQDPELSSLESLIILIVTVSNLFLEQGCTLLNWRFLDSVIVGVLCLCPNR